MLSAIVVCALAGVTVESAERLTFAIAGMGEEGREESTAALGAWSSDLYFEVMDGMHRPRFPSWGRATQDSLIVDGDSGLISGSGILGGYDGLLLGGAGSGGGYTHVRTVFTLDTASQATFTVDAEMSGTAAILSVYLLSTPAGGAATDLFRWVLPTLDLDTTWTGELPPGRYTFRVIFTAGGGGQGTGGGMGTYDFELAVPAPGAWAWMMAGLVACRRRR